MNRTSLVLKGFVALALAGITLGATAAPVRHGAHHHRHHHHHHVAHHGMVRGR